MNEQSNQIPLNQFQSLSVGTFDDYEYDPELEVENNETNKTEKTVSNNT